MFDPSNADSFEHLVNWYRDIENYCSNLKTLKIVLVALVRTGGNHTIKERVSEALIDDFQQEHEIICGFCSVDLTSGDNYKEPFEILMRYTTTEDLNSGRKSTINLLDKFNKISELPYEKEASDDTKRDNKCCLVS
jgi:hypothetical protein